MPINITQVQRLHTGASAIIKLLYYWNEKGATEGVTNASKISIISTQYRPQKCVTEWKKNCL